MRSAVLAALMLVCGPALAQSTDPLSPPATNGPVATPTPAPTDAAPTAPLPQRRGSGTVSGGRSCGGTSAAPVS